jgi:hypothetical protein
VVLVEYATPWLHEERGYKGHIRRSTGGLQKSRLADIALDIPGLLVDLQLRLCDFSIFVFAIPL